MRRWIDGSWPIVLVFTLALALRCYGLSAPLLDYHSWRQADTAAIARNFVDGGYQLLYPQVDWGGLTPGYVESEFPLYSFSLALLYGALGVHEWLGRLLTALASAAIPVALYLLARPTGQRAALYAGLALALSPFAIYFGRTVMPDAWMLLTATLAILTFKHWLEQRSAMRLGIALICGALAPLAKTPNLLIVAVPVCYLVWRARPPYNLWPALAIYGLCFALPALVWTQHARTLPLDPRLSFGIGEKLFDDRLLIDPQFYLLIARWSISSILTPVGALLFVIGLLRRGGQESQGSGAILWPYLADAWLLGVVFFLLAGAAGVVGQDYYILPLAGPGAWLIGRGLDWVQTWVERRWVGRWRARAMAITGLGTLALFSFVRVAPLYESAGFYQTLGRRLELALPAGERVGVIAPAVSEILYYGKRKGWRLDPGVLVPGGLSSLGPDLGVRYVLIADPWLSERRDVLSAALHDYRRVPVGPYALLLDLTRPGLTMPGEMVWETGHVVAEPFLGAWDASGRSAGLGYPLSDALAGPQGWEQYFEHGLLLEQDGHISRAPVGRLLLEAQGLVPQPAEAAGVWGTVWQQSGGQDRLGAALSPPLERAEGGQIQFFEFGTLEQEPGGTPIVGASGRRLLAARGLTEERQIELARRQE